MPRVGGITEEAQAATDETRGIAEQIRAAAQEKTGRTYEVFELHSYKTQVVSGVNYFMKIHVGGEYIHARVYRHFSGGIQLSSVEVGKAEGDPIEYF